MNVDWTARGACRVLLACTLLVGCGGCGNHATESRTNLLLISVDTLRPDYLGCYNVSRKTSPNLDDLAKRGVLFESAFAPRGATWPSLTSLMTAKYPLSHGVRNNGEALDPLHTSLARFLKKEGYSTAAFLSNFRLAKQDGFDRVWAIEDRIGALKHVQPHFVWDDAITEEGLTWLEGHADRPFFLWLHYMDPHEDYLPPSPYDKSFTDPDYEGDATGRAQTLMNITLGAPVQPEDIEHIRGLYAGQILSTDRSIGRVLDRLDELALRENTLIVFVSDHGEELFDHHRYFFHAASIYDSSLRIPLIFSHPKAVPHGVRIESPVEITDVLPTVLALLNVSPPSSLTAPWDGEDLGPLIRGLRTERTSPATFHEWVSPNKLHTGEPKSVIYAVRKGRYKLIDNPTETHPDNPPYRDTGSGFPIARRELYDIFEDPLEQNNLATTENETKLAPVIEELAKILEKWKSRLEENATRSGEMSEQTRQELIALGYLPEEEDGEEEEEEEREEHKKDGE